MSVSTKSYGQASDRPSPSHVRKAQAVNGNLLADKIKTFKMDTISPNIFVEDINKTIDFYKQLGFNIVASVPDKGDLVWAMMNCGNVNFMFQTFSSLGDEFPTISRQNGGSLLLYIQIKGIRQFHDHIKDKVKILKGLEKAFYGATEFSIQDINNYVLTFAEDE